MPQRTVGLQLHRTESRAYCAGSNKQQKCPDESSIQFACIVLSEKRGDDRPVPAHERKLTQPRSACLGQAAALLYRATNGYDRVVRPGYATLNQQQAFVRNDLHHWLA